MESALSHHSLSRGPLFREGVQAHSRTAAGYRAYVNCEILRLDIVQEKKKVVNVFLSDAAKFFIFNKMSQIYTSDKVIIL